MENRDPKSEKPVLHSSTPLSAARRLSSLSLSANAIFFLIMVFIVVFILLLGWLVEQNRFNSCQRLMSDGRTVSANVTEVEGDNEGGVLVRYRFPAIKNGLSKTFRGSVQVFGLPGIGIPKVGQVIEVVYEVSNPDNSEVSSLLKTCQFDMAPVLIASGFLLIIGTFLSLGDYLKERIRKLR